MLPKVTRDGQPVNIPALEHSILEDDAVEILGKIIGFRGWIIPTVPRTRLPRKVFQKLLSARSVPQTDTGRQA